MWLEVIYRPTTLFSLKQSDATNSAAKTLPVPSPYTLKMALLNAIIIFDSKESAVDLFEKIKNLELQFSLPQNFIINNCFIKIHKEMRSESKKDEWDTFQSTVAFREYVYFDDVIKIAIKLDENDNQCEFLKKWLPHINYFGKRGCFFQFTKFNLIDTLSEDYSSIFEEDSILKPGTFYKMDDFGKKTTFEKVNTYSSEKTDRLPRTYLFPINSLKMTKGFTFYKRVTP